PGGDPEEEASRHADERRRRPEPDGARGPRLLPLRRLRVGHPEGGLPPQGMELRRHRARVRAVRLIPLTDRGGRSASASSRPRRATTGPGTTPRSSMTSPAPPGECTRDDARRWSPTGTVTL